VDWFFQAKNEDVVKFVVDRRPSKTVLTDTHLWNTMETTAASTSAALEMTRLADDDDVDDDLQCKGSKRCHSHVARDHNVEYTAAESEIPVPDSSDNSKGHERGPQLERDGKKKKRRKTEKEEHVTYVVTKVAEDANRDTAMIGDLDRKKRKKMNLPVLDADNIENRIEDSAVVMRDGSSGLVSSPHDGSKKSLKNRAKNFVGIEEEGGTGEKRFLVSGHPANIEQVSSATDVASVSPRKLHHKKRLKHCREMDVSSHIRTAEADPHMASYDASVYIHSSFPDEDTADGMKSSRGKETLGVEKSASLEGPKSMDLLQLVMQGDDDDDDDELLLGTDIADHPRINVPLTSAHAVFSSSIKPPSIVPHMTEALDETGIAETPLATQTARHEVLPSLIGQLPATAVKVLI